MPMAQLRTADVLTLCVHVRQGMFLEVLGCTIFSSSIFLMYALLIVVSFSVSFDDFC